MLNHPEIKLKQVAKMLGVTRQRVALMIGALNRPSCAHPDKPAPRKEQAETKLAELKARVAAGEPAQAVVKELGISFFQAMRLGFRARSVFPTHGTQARLRSGCSCWRCRRAGGLSVPRGPRLGTEKKAQVLDWLAWVDPEDGIVLTQAAIGQLVGVAQQAVSRIARASRVDIFS
jgi:predicted XRE-type DNA-binding protein